MRGLLFLLPLGLAACSTPSGPYPSLSPRAAEATDPRVPVPGPPAQAEPTPALARELAALVASAIAADSAFERAAAEAQRLAAAAGPSQSESWVVAQQALSAAVAARAPVTRALAEIDALGAGRIQEFGGLGTADAQAISSAAERVGEIDRRQAAAIDRIQARLGS